MKTFSSPGLYADGKFPLNQKVLKETCLQEEGEIFSPSIVLFKIFAGKW